MSSIKHKAYRYIPLPDLEEESDRAYIETSELQNIKDTSDITSIGLSIKDLKKISKSVLYGQYALTLPSSYRVQIALSYESHKDIYDLLMRHFSKFTADTTSTLSVKPNKGYKKLFILSSSATCDAHSNVDILFVVKDKALTDIKEAVKDLKSVKPYFIASTTTRNYLFDIALLNRCWSRANNSTQNSKGW